MLHILVLLQGCILIFSCIAVQNVNKQSAALFEGENLAFVGGLYDRRESDFGQILCGICAFIFTFPILFYISSLCNNLHVSIPHPVPPAAAGKNVNLKRSAAEFDQKC